MAQITVGIPAYKAMFLSQAIASVLAQTFTDFELLISDDCPDDSVRAVVDGFRDPRIRLIAGPRRGLVANSAHLWAHATCDLLKYVYDDDFLLPFALEALRAALDTNPEATYAFSHRYLVDGAGRIKKSPLALKGEATLTFAASVVPETIIRNMRNFVGEPTNVLIRRSAFRDAGCLSSYCGLEIRHMIDVAFYLNAGLHGPCVGIPEFHAAFRQHENQVSAQRTAPGFAMGFIEWELFVRGSVQNGLVSPASTEQAVPWLERAYRMLDADFPEVSPLRAGLPGLQARLRGGETDLLDSAFMANWGAAHERADRRLAAAGAQEAATFDQLSFKRTPVQSVLSPASR